MGSNRASPETVMPTARRNRPRLEHAQLLGPDEAAGARTGAVGERPHDQRAVLRRVLGDVRRIRGARPRHVPEVEQHSVLLTDRAQRVARLQVGPLVPGEHAAIAVDHANRALAVRIRRTRERELLGSVRLPQARSRDTGRAQRLVVAADPAPVGGDAPGLAGTDRHVARQRGRIDGADLRQPHGRHRRWTRRHSSDDHLPVVGDVVGNRRGRRGGAGGDREPAVGLRPDPRPESARRPMPAADHLPVGGHAVGARTSDAHEPRRLGPSEPVGRLPEVVGLPADDRAPVGRDRSGERVRPHDREVLRVDRRRRVRQQPEGEREAEHGGAAAWDHRAGSHPKTLAEDPMRDSS